MLVCVRAQAGVTCLHVAKLSVVGKRSGPRTFQGVTCFPVAYKIEASEQVEKGWWLSRRLLSRPYAHIFPEACSVIPPPYARQSSILNRAVRITFRNPWACAGQKIISSFSLSSNWKIAFPSIFHGGSKTMVYEQDPPINITDTFMSQWSVEDTWKNYLSSLNFKCTVLIGPSTGFYDLTYIFLYPKF